MSICMMSEAGASGTFAIGFEFPINLPNFFLIHFHHVSLYELTCNKKEIEINQFSSFKTKDYNKKKRICSLEFKINKKMVYCLKIKVNNAEMKLPIHNSSISLKLCKVIFNREFSCLFIYYSHYMNKTSHRTGYKTRLFFFFLLTARFTVIVLWTIRRYFFYFFLINRQIE